MNCTETNCEFCSDDYQSCGGVSYSGVFTGGTDLIASLTYIFHYTSGNRTELLTFFDYERFFNIKNATVVQRVIYFGEGA